MNQHIIISVYMYAQTWVFLITKFTNNCFFPMLYIRSERASSKYKLIITFTDLLLLVLLQLDLSKKRLIHRYSNYEMLTGKMCKNEPIK